MSHPATRNLFVCSLLAVSSCTESDQRLLDLSRQSLETQSRQNEQQARQSAAVAGATRDLLRSQNDAQARQHDREQQLLAERQTLQQERKSLDQERQELIDARIREPLIAEALLTVVSWLLAAFPLFLCWLLLRRTPDLPVAPESDPLVTDLLLEELTAETPRLFPRPNAPQLPALPSEPSPSGELP